MPRIEIHGGLDEMVIHNLSPLTIVRGPITKITVDGEEWVPRVYPNKPQFKVGDFVRVIKASYGTLTSVGECGEVVSIIGEDIGVKLPAFTSGHDANAGVKGKHGWYFPPSYLELI